MKDFAGKVAVVTGGASGIGNAVAERLAQEGMRVVLADVEEAALDDAVVKLRQQEHEVIGVLTDTSKLESVTALKARVVAEYGPVSIVVNNAGVGGGGRGPIWENTEDDWNWVMGVNLWGVINGVRTFMPDMVDGGEPGHVVNTASIAGLIYGNGIYGVTKHAVVAISESIYQQLAAAKSNVGVSVLCPGFVQTRIHESGRNRPDHMPEPPPPADPVALARQNMVVEAIKGGMPPSEVADKVFNAIRDDQFYVITHDTFDEPIQNRFDSIASRSNPVVQEFGALRRPSGA
jgi:NAD(P)-dependent dehydrogenase (short-subunit alcohol dehydrogenase family)